MLAAGAEIIPFLKVSHSPKVATASEAAAPRSPRTPRMLLARRAPRGSATKQPSPCAALSRCSASHGHGYGDQLCCAVRRCGACCQLQLPTCWCAPRTTHFSLRWLCLCARYCSCRVTVCTAQRPQPACAVYPRLQLYSRASDVMGKTALFRASIAPFVMCVTLPLLLRLFASSPEVKYSPHQESRPNDDAVRLDFASPTQILHAIWILHLPQQARLSAQHHVLQAPCTSVRQHANMRTPVPVMRRVSLC